MSALLVIFACMILNKTDLEDFILQAESIREFTGDSRQSEIRCYLPLAKSALADQAVRERLAILNVKLIEFELDSFIVDFPYAAKVFAAALAEEETAGRCTLLIWTDPDNIFINPLAELLLPANKMLGCRPVFQTNIGSPAALPPDLFWQQLYTDCQTDTAGLQPMETIIDRQKLRPYYNAGLLVVRPQTGLLRQWRDNFKNIYSNSRYTGFYTDQRYKIFNHQAVLAATAGELFKQKQIQLFSGRVNHSLFFHEKYPADSRPQTVNEVINLRHEWFWRNPHWREILPAADPLKSWIIQHRNDSLLP